MGTLIAVGGGAFLVPDRLAGISEVVRVPHGDCANAVGAATAALRLARRRGKGCTNRGEAGRVAMGALAPSASRRPTRRYAPDGVHPPVYVHEPGFGHNYRGHGQPRASQEQSRYPAARAIAAR